MKLALFLSAALLAATAMAQDLVALLPDFPCHWNQAQPYNQVVQDEYGLNKPVGCVAVAGASILEYFKWPRESFGPASIIMDVTREIRTEPLDWARLAPTPLDARGRRTAQTVLYNLGLLTQMNYWGNGLSSTTPLSNLQKAFRSDSVGMASAYYVALGEGATEEDFETAIWASLRCGSPVAMSVGKNSAHAVVACGYRQKADEPGYETYIFSGYGSGLALQTLPNVAGYTFIEAVVTGIVAERPEGVTSSYALPVLGTVVDENNNPVHFARITLSINGQVVAETFSDAKGRYGLWGWFGHDMTLSCEGQEIKRTATTAPVDVRDGVPYMDVNDLRSAIVANTSNFRLPVAERPTIYTDLEEAKTAAQANNKRILCLNNEDPDLKEAFREVNKYTLLYADPRQDAPIPEVDTRPDATAFILDYTEKIINYTVAKSVSDLNAFIANPTNPGENNIKGDSSITTLYNGKDAKFSSGVTITVDDDIRLGNIAVGADVTFTGNGTLTWGTLSQSGLITLAGPNLRYIPPKVGDGTSSAFPASFTVKNGAELYFGNGDVSGYGVTTGTITIGPKGILCVASRDTLNRPLVLAGGEVHLGNKGGDFGSLDLFSTTIKVTADSSISGLSGANNPQLMVRDGTSTITLSNDARLSVSVPINAADKSKDTLSLSGNGVVDFDTVSAPVIAGFGVLLEGGTFSGGLSLTNGARLSALHPITVTGTLTVSGTVSIEEPRSGVFLRGNANTTIATSAFTAPNGFTVKKVGNDYRLVASSATAPVWYANGVRVEPKPEGVAPENRLLVLTTTDRKESGLWEDYAAFRSSPAGGGWNVCVAANGNIPEDQATTDYIHGMDCDYVLIGASGAEIPALDGTIDRLANFHIGRLPLRESIRMGTKVNPGGTGAQVYEKHSDYEILDAYVDKLKRAGDKHARGVIGLVGGDYGTKELYTNNEPYEEVDGLPANSAPSWNLKYYTGYTLFALRDRYRELKKVAPEVFPTLTALVSTTAPAYSVELIYSADGALLWAEDGDGRQALGPLLVGTAGVSKCVVDAIPGLYSLVVTPSGQSGDFSQADSPSVGEMLVLNPQGGALTVFAPTGTDATLTVSATGIPSSNTHTVCAAVAEALIENPTLTVGQALNQALTDNSGLSTTLTLLGDPTVRVMAWPEPKPVLSEEVTLSEETLNALRAVAEAAGLFKDYEVVVSGLDGAARPIAELDDALACFTGLEPTVENGKVVVAYDFSVTGLRLEDNEVVLTLSVRGKEGQTVSFAEDNAYAIAPQRLDGTQPLAAPETVTATTNEGSTVELRFSLPEGDATFLFRATVSRPTP